MITGLEPQPVRTPSNSWKDEDTGTRQLPQEICSWKTGPNTNKLSIEDFKKSEKIKYTINAIPDLDDETLSDLRI